MTGYNTYDKVERITFDTPMTVQEVLALAEYAGQLEAGNKVKVQLMCSGKVAIVKIAYRPSNEEVVETIEETISAVTTTTEETTEETPAPVETIEETAKTIVDTVNDIDNNFKHPMDVYYHTNWYDQRKTYCQNFNKYCHSCRVCNKNDLVEVMKKISEFNSAMPNNIYEVEFNWAGKVLFKWTKN